MSIGNQFVFDVNGNVEDFIFILSTKDFKHLGALQNVISDSTHNSGNLMSANDISFEVCKSLEKEVDEEMIFVEEPLWDEIDNLKLVYVRELDEYFEMDVQLDDTTDVVKKTVTCTSLCEAELGQLGIHGLEINTESDISRPDYVPTIFYNIENTKASLLDRIVSSFAPNYTIKHVDESLWNIQRTFSVDGTNVYDWFMGDCSKEFNCIFMFDSTERGIYVYDLFTVCKDCGYRGEYIDKCPKCGSINLDTFGDDTGIYIDKENLTDAIQLTTDKDSIKNCFKLVAGDDVMTAMIRLINPNGSSFIYKPTDSQLSEMPKELLEKLSKYNELYDSKQEEYEGLLADIFEVMGKIDELTHTMMPSVEYEEVTAQSEASKLNSMNINLLGMSVMSSSTNPSKSTVESALVNYARVFVNTGAFKISVNNSSYSFKGIGSDGWNYGTWTGNFKVESYVDKKDIAYSPTITVKVTEDYGTFIEQKIMKNISNNSDKGSVFDVLSIEELDDFKEALKLYCLNRLQSFGDAIQTALTTLLELDQASQEADYYEAIYLPYYNKLQACQKEINTRQSEIDSWQYTYDNLILQQEELQAELNFEDYLGEDLYKIYNLYRREDVYQNDNYISDGLDTSEQLKKAKEFFEVANQELEKARTPKHSITSTLYNLLIIPEFKPLIHKFKLGNWLRICVDGEIYKLMLVGYRLSFSSIQTLEVTFSNVTKVNSPISQRDELFDLVKSMASTYDYYASQAKKGNESYVEINRWFENGLNSSLINIKNNNNEDPVFDKHGIWGRAYDSITGNILPEQFRATHNILAFTTDGFKTVKAALGKHNYYKFDEAGNLVQDTAYGLSCDFVTSGVVYGSQIISGDIYSENYKVDANGNVIQGSHLALKTGGFSLASGKLTYDPVADKITLKGVTIQWSSSTTPEISDINGLETSLSTTLEKAEQGIQKGLEGINLANNAQTYAESVNASLSTEITNRINADSKLSTDLTTAYQEYANSKVSSLDKSVADYLGVGGGTLITEKGVISPYIAGGYLNITNTSNKCRVIIDPNNLTGNGYIFQVHNGSQISVGIKSNGDAIFSGDIVAKSLTLGTGVAIPSTSIDGIDNYATKTSLNNYVTNTSLSSQLQSYATTGELQNYLKTNDLNAKLGDLNVAYRGDVQTAQTTNNTTGIITTTSTYKGADGKTYTTTTYTTSDSNYVLLSRDSSWGEGTLNYDGTTNNKTLVKISKDGLLTANNAIIRGTIYATEGIFSGMVSGGSININNRFIVDEYGNVTLPDNAKISWSNVDNKPTIPTKTSQLTNDKGYETATSIKSTVITKDYIESLKIKAYSVDAENISGTTITGKTISGGSINIGNGVFTVSNKGEIKATAGLIGSWGIYDSSVLGSAYGSTGKFYGMAFDARESMFTGAVNGGTGGRVLAIGHLGHNNTTTVNDAMTKHTWENASFIVRANGEVTANNLKTNNITATGGKIGGWEITESYLGGASGEYTIRLYPNGYSYGGTMFFLVVFKYGTGIPKGGITVDGWVDIT